MLLDKKNKKAEIGDCALKRLAAPRAQEDKVYALVDLKRLTFCLTSNQPANFFADSFFLSQDILSKASGPANKLRAAIQFSVEYSLASVELVVD